MTIHDQNQHLDLETGEDADLVSRRTVVRRSVLGIAGVGMASLLAACGGDDDEVDDTGPTGLDEIDDEPIDEDPAGGGGMDADGGADTADGAGGAG